MQKLEAWGASFIAIPCNTAHLYFTELQKCIRIPLLNIIDATLSQIPKSTKKMTILGTRPTLASEIYQKGLDHSEVTCILHPEWQETIDQILLCIKSPACMEVAIDFWKALSKNFDEEGIDTILVACTDLNAILKAAPPSLPIIDSSACLAEVVVKKWGELNG